MIAVNCESNLPQTQKASSTKWHLFIIALWCLPVSAIQRFTGGWTERLWISTGLWILEVCVYSSVCVCVLYEGCISQMIPFGDLPLPPTQFDTPWGDPQWVWLLHKPLPLSPGRTCDLLLANGIWLRWWDAMHFIGLHYARLLSWLEQRFFSWPWSCCVVTGPHGKEGAASGDKNSPWLTASKKMGISVSLQLQWIGFCQRTCELGRRLPAPEGNTAWLTPWL